MTRINLANIQIPADCTHWVKVPAMVEGRPDQYRFYKVFGPNNDIIFIWWRDCWTPFAEYQNWVLDHTPARTAPRKPDFNHRCFNRQAETANDKIKRVAEKLAQQGA